MAPPTRNYIEDLPLLKWVVNEWAQKNKKPLKNFRIFLIIHLLKDASAFMEALFLLGAEPKNVFIVGKPYSTLNQPVKEIKKLGFENIFTPKNMNDFETQVKHAIKLTVKKNTDVLVLEDGGYCLKVIRDLKLEKKARIHGLVEQTTIGIWRDKEQLKKRTSSFPIINVAESPSKKKLEPVVVGHAIRKNILEMLIKMQKSLTGKTIFINGYGSIGSQVAVAVKQNNAVYVNDILPLARIEARQEGYLVTNLLEALERADIVIGCSGHTWLTKKEIPRLKNNAIIVCATSERVEYDHEALLKLSKTTKIIPKIGLQCNLKSGKNLMLLAEGYPINFYGSTKDSVPFENFQVISALLLWGLLLLTKKLKIKSIMKFPIKDEKKILEEYERIVWGSS